MEQGAGAAEELRPLVRPDRAEIADPVAVEPRRHELVEVALVLDDSGKDERNPRLLGDVDRLHRPLVGVDPAEEQQVPAGGRVEREGVGVDPVVDRREVVEARVPVGVADRDVGAAPRCSAGRPGRIRGDEKPWIVVRTGVSTSSL